MNRLEGEVALITGGASGIGFAIAQSLAAEGMKLAIADIDDGTLTAAANSLGESGAIVVAHKLDVCDPDAWGRAVQRIEEELGPIAVLCNNAGVGLASAPAEEIAPIDWNWVVGVNLGGVHLGVRAVAPGMKARGRGHIVNTSSILGLFPKANHTAYVASKFAVVGFTEALRAELAPYGVGVSVLLPGLVRTAQMANSQARRPSRQSKEVTATVTSESKPPGIDPGAVGGVVLDAIRHDRLYAISHGEYLPVITDRSQRLLRAFQEASREEGKGEDIGYLGGDSLAMA